jgi:hypothetical protein
MFPINTILAWEINIYINMEYDNNHFIITSWAYFFQSSTCTRVNNLADTCVYKTYGFHVLSIRVAYG